MQWMCNLRGGNFTFKKFAMIVVATGFILAGGTGLISATEIYSNIYSVDCGKTVPTTG